MTCTYQNIAVNIAVPFWQNHIWLVSWRSILFLSHTEQKISTIEFLLHFETTVDELGRQTSEWYVRLMDGLTDIAFSHNFSKVLFRLYQFLVVVIFIWFVSWSLSGAAAVAHVLNDVFARLFFARPPGGQNLYHCCLGFRCRFLNCLIRFFPIFGFQILLLVLYYF